MLSFLNRVIARENLSAGDAQQAMSALLDGAVSESTIAGFLVALKMKGETADELAGFARALRERMVRVDAGDDVIDTCGTGGDGCNTFNISTAAALVMAGAGAHVAKHGNRSISSQCGSADVFEALGVRIVLTAEEAAQAIREIGIGFVFAPHMHPAMKVVQPVRRELKMRTTFNLLGPLVNPAGTRVQLVGAPSVRFANLLAEALAQLGTRRAFVVHGRDGLDEITTTCETDVFEVRGEEISKSVWSPESFAVERTTLAALAGGDAGSNASIITEVLNGAKGPRRDIVLVNAAAGLLAGGLATDLPEGIRLAAESIDSGAAKSRLGLLQKNFPIV
jgi:anthranilate phosphoribosyltransferase